MPQVDKVRAEAIHAAWHAASDTEKLVMPRVSWFGTGPDDMSYFEEAPTRLELAAAERIAELEAENAFVREKIADYVKSGFDPGMMSPTIDDIRHHLKIEAE